MTHAHAEREQGHGARRSKLATLHQDWRTWIVVLLMLAAMAAYVLSDDESIQPQGAPGQRQPAAAAAP